MTVFLWWTKTIKCCTSVPFSGWLTGLAIICFIRSFCHSHLSYLDTISNSWGFFTLFCSLFFHLINFFPGSFLLFPAAVFFFPGCLVFNHWTPSPILLCYFASISLAAYSIFPPAVPCFLCALHCCWICFSLLSFLSVLQSFIIE